MLLDVSTVAINFNFLYMCVYRCTVSCKLKALKRVDQNLTCMHGKIY